MFQINIKNSVICLIKDFEDISVSEAAETIYSDSSGWIAEMNWNGYIIPLFGSSIGSIYTSVINILEYIRLGKKSFIEIFLDNSFTAKWECSLEGDKIKIIAFFIDIANTNKHTPIENLLNEHNVLIMKQEDFIYEWNKLLGKVKKDLISVGYDNTLKGFEYLDAYII